MDAVSAGVGAVADQAGVKDAVIVSKKTISRSGRHRQTEQTQQSNDCFYFLFSSRSFLREAVINRPLQKTGFSFVYSRVQYTFTIFSSFSLSTLLFSSLYSSWETQMVTSRQTLIEDRIHSQSFSSLAFFLGFFSVIMIFSWFYNDQPCIATQFHINQPLWAIISAKFFLCQDKNLLFLSGCRNHKSAIDAQRRPESQPSAIKKPRGSHGA